MSRTHSPPPDPRAIHKVKRTMNMLKLISSPARGAILWAVVCVSLAMGAHGQEPANQVVHASRDTNIAVPIYKSRIVVLPAEAKRVSIGNLDIADVLILRSNELYILGKDLGSTNVLLWDRNDVLVSAIAVAVTHDLDGLKARL